MNDLETKKKKLKDLLSRIDILESAIKLYKNKGIPYDKEVKDLSSCLEILENNKQNCPEFFV